MEISEAKKLLGDLNDLVHLSDSLRGFGNKPEEKTKQEITRERILNEITELKESVKKLESNDSYLTKQMKGFDQRVIESEMSSIGVTIQDINLIAQRIGVIDRVINNAVEYIEQIFNALTEAINKTGYPEAYAIARSSLYKIKGELQHIQTQQEDIKLNLGRLQEKLKVV